MVAAVGAGACLHVMLWTPEAVDRFLSCDKTLVGDGDWVCDPSDDECWLKFTIAVAGVPTQSTFEVVDYPVAQPRGFGMTLNVPPCVWRLDFDPPWKIHTNDVPEFHECQPLIRGPHYHPWHLNRRFHKGKNIPSELPLALPLDEGIKSFKSALDWFCAQVKITFEKGQLPELPPAGRLI